MSEVCDGMSGMRTWRMDLGSVADVCWEGERVCMCMSRSEDKLASRMKINLLLVEMCTERDAILLRRSHLYRRSCCVSTISIRWPSLVQSLSSLSPTADYSITHSHTSTRTHTATNDIASMLRLPQRCGDAAAVWAVFEELLAPPPHLKSRAPSSNHNHRPETDLLRFP